MKSSCHFLLSHFGTQLHSAELKTELTIAVPYRELAWTGLHFKLKTVQVVKVILRLTVSQSVSLGVEPHLGFMTRYLLLFDSYGLFVGHPLWREDGSVFSICCWPLPKQSFSGPSPSYSSKDQNLLRLLKGVLICSSVGIENSAQSMDVCPKFSALFFSIRTDLVKSMEPSAIS
jgi:hypothetical protein